MYQYSSFAEANDFSEAATTFDLLIENPSSGYALQENFAALFDENNQANSEVIWAIQYGLDKNYRGGGNPQQAQFGFNIVALYKRQNKLFHFHKTFCSEFDIINTKQNVHFTKVVSYLPVLFIFASV